MTCGERQEKFVEWILEELPAEEARALELHVEQCRECAGALAGLRNVEQALKQHLTDSEMPARLVLVPEQPAAVFAGLWARLARTAAMAATAALVFVAVVFGAYAAWGDRLPRRAQAAPSRAEVEILVAQAVERGLEPQRKEFAAAREAMVANLRQEQAQTLAAIRQQLNYLEAAQKAVWRENQEQNAVMQYIAQTALQAGPAKP